MFSKTPDDLKLIAQASRCREALRVAGVPQWVLDKFNPSNYPLLFQFAHMVVFLEQPWRDALLWVNDHRGEIFAYARGEIDNEGRAKRYQGPDDAHVVAADQGQPVQLGDDGIPMGEKGLTS